MPYVDGYDYDLFVSYARVDDATFEGAGPVSLLVRYLEIALGNRLGVEPRVFFDVRTGVNEATQLDDIREAAPKAALFLAIGSPAYIRRRWTLQELEIMRAQADALDRLFVAEFLPLAEGETYPEPLPRLIHSRFWQEDATTRVAMPLRPDPGGVYASRVQDLAAKMRCKLAGLVRPPAPPSPDRRKALIAQVPDDMDEHAAQLRRYLGQYEREVEMLPGEDYPQGGADFTAAFGDDLRRADLFVQILGRNLGRKPKDLPAGYTCHQFAAARAEGKRILQWRPPELDLETVEDPAYRALLESSSVRASGFEDFKACVLATIRDQARPAAPANAQIAFIDADQVDLDLAEFIRSTFYETPFSAVLPPAEGDSARELRERCEQMFTQADVLVLVHGQIHPLWVEGNIRLFDRIWDQRRVKPRALGVCTVLPAAWQEFKSQKCPVLHLDLSAGFREEPIRAFVRELTS